SSDPFTYRPQLSRILHLIAFSPQYPSRFHRARHSSVSYPSHSHCHARLLPQRLLHLLSPAPRLIPLYPPLRLQRLLLLSHLHHHVIAEPAQLVIIVATLQPPLHASHLLPSPSHLLEQPPVQHQFLLLPLSLLDASPQFLHTHFSRRLVELHRRVIRLQQRQTPHVSYKDAPSPPRHPHRFLHHLQQVVHVREVLRHRVQDHQIHTLIAHKTQLVRQPLSQPHELEIDACREIGPQLRHHFRREVYPHVALTLPGQPRQQQPCPAADLQHPARPQPPQMRHRLLHPDLHLLGRYRLACITALPSRQVEISRPFSAPPVDRFVEFSPLFEAPFPPLLLPTLALPPRHLSP